jgi:6-phosphogluconolactonase
VTGPNIRRFVDRNALCHGAARLVVEHIVEALAKRGQCRLALAGGSTPRPVYERLAGPLRGEVDWAAMHLFWGDERCVPPEHPDSNYRMVQEVLLRHVAVPGGQVHRINGELEPSQAARHYAKILGDEPLDLVLLGMGGDGHVASLFPDTPDLRETLARVVATKSPIPPVDRVSLSLRTLNEARVVLFLVGGASKAERLAEVLQTSGSSAASLPAAMVRGPDASWLVDAAAAAQL